VDDKFQNDYPIANDLVMELFNRVNELEYQNAQLKLELEQYWKAELENEATRKFVYDNMFVINYMHKYLKDIGVI
jgi:hypothetical protein